MLPLVMALLGCVTALPCHAQQRPNIVYFFADDLGWAGIKANLAIAKSKGVNTAEGEKIVTPNIDALVAGGVNFIRSYGNPVCSPSRSAQQTGFHQGHTWSDRNDPDASKAMRTQDPTIGDLLAAAGYRNGMYGKWGYGASEDLTHPVINNEQTLPIKHGYHDCLAELHHVRAHTFLQPSLWYSFVDSNGVVVTDTTLVANTNSYPELQHPDGTFYCDNLYAAAAEDFIRTEAHGPSPFFVQVSFQIPHTPYGDITRVPGWFDDYASVDTTGWTDAQKQYAAMLTLMDKRIGDILAALRDPNGDSNQADSVMANTLVIFGSDNGGDNTAATVFSNNGHLRGYKGSVYEGGIRVPLVFYWEGTIAPGQTSSRRVDVADMLPTFCELARVDQPVGLDGVSFAALLTGVGELRQRPYLAYEDHNNAAVLWALIKDDYKLIKRSNGSLELYDLVNDESESLDLAGDPAYSALRDRLLVIALAENLEENDDYANVFPTWVGGEGADLPDTNSWTPTGTWPFPNIWPYGGSPQANWNAVLRNTAPTNRTAVQSVSLETLGMEIAGNAHPVASQTLVLAGGVSLTGRNEIRISPHGILRLDGGALITERWVEVRSNATLVGAGSITGTVMNAGAILVSQSSGGVVPGTPVELLGNGGFEAGTDLTFAGTDQWFNDAGNQTLNARNTSNPAAGTYRGIVGMNANGIDQPSPAQDTGHTIALGDVYTLAFSYAGASGWDLGVDQFRAVLYYLDSETPVTVWGAELTPTLNFGTGYESHNTTVAPVTDSNAVGRSLLLRFETLAQAGEFASVDNVTLTLPGVPVVANPTRTLSVSGDFRSLGNTCQLEVELAGSASPGVDYSECHVGGVAYLAGTIEVDLVSGFVPAPGTVFGVLSVASLVGQFDLPDQTVHSGDSHLQVSYSSTNVLLRTLESGLAPMGTPHWWLQIHGYTNASYPVEELLDHDGDRHPTWAEYVAGTDPGDSNSVLRASIGTTTAADAWVLAWPAADGRQYDIQTSTNPVSGFQPLAPGLMGTPPQNRFTNPIVDSGTTTFLRLHVRIAP